MLGRETLRRSRRGGGHSFSNDSSVHICYADIEDQLQAEGTNARSYKDSVLGHTITTPSSEGIKAHTTDKDGTEEINDNDMSYDHLSMKLNIFEKKHGEYDCLEMVIPPREEAMICRPWRKGLIVKLLGRKIGYKALENCLQQMWVRKGALSLVDLDNDLFLVYMSHEEDQTKALTDGPSLIYGHYLTVKEWSPTFARREAP